MRTYADKTKADGQTGSAKSTIQARGFFGQSREANSIFPLQPAIGNQGERRLMQSKTGELEVGPVSTVRRGFAHDFSRISIYAKTSSIPQTKQTVNKPGDVCEQEADRVAEQVTRMSEVRRRRAYGGGCPKCQMEQPEREKERLQTKRIQGNCTEHIAVQPIVHEVLRSSGQPLDPVTRAFFEPRFGRDFSRVQVHTDGKASESARTLNARAYTVGQDLVFGAGQYAQRTEHGKRLLAHELAHVVQQSSSTPSIQRNPLTEQEKQKDLTSEKYAWNNRLQNVYDNNPSMRMGETGEAVRLVQEGLAADGIALPISTNKETGELDGIFGQETYKGVQEFQYKYASDGLLDPHGRADGIVGRNTMGKLDDLAQQGKVLPICQDFGQVTGEQTTEGQPDQTYSVSTGSFDNSTGPCAKPPCGKKTTHVTGTTRCPPFAPGCSNPDIILKKPYIVFVLCKTDKNTNDGPGSIDPKGCTPNWNVRPGTLMFSSLSKSNKQGWKLKPELEYFTCRPREGDKWEWGFMQTVEYAIMGGGYSNNQRHIFIAVRRARDAREKDTPSPWYDKPGNDFGPQVVGFRPLIADSPWVELPVKHKNSRTPDLHRVFINGTFYTWLIVKQKRTSPQNADFLYHWRFDVCRSWDFRPQQTGIHPCQISAWVASGGQNTAFEGVGQGPGTPVWDTPIANFAKKEYWLP